MGAGRAALSTKVASIIAASASLSFSPWYSIWRQTEPPRVYRRVKHSKSESYDNVQIDFESFYDGIGTSGYEGYGLSLSAEMKF